MTAAKSTGRTTRGAKKDPEGPALEVVQDETVTSDVKTTKRAKIHRDLTPSGIGMVGGFEDVEPDAVPASGKSVDVSYLFEPLQDSYAKAKWKSQVVMDVDAAERAIRLAAMKLGYGIKIRTEAVTYEQDGETVEATRVFFKAGEKVVRRSGKDVETSQAE